jgi:hypothetical protein
MVKGKKINAIYCDLLDTVKLVSDELGGICTIHAGTKHSLLKKLQMHLHTQWHKKQILHTILIFKDRQAC